MKSPADQITNDQLHALYAQHCTCCPLDLGRASEDHAKTCNIEILHDVQYALGIRWFNDIGRIQAARGARARCAKVFFAQTQDRLTRSTLP